MSLLTLVKGSDAPKLDRMNAVLNLCVKFRVGCSELRHSFWSVFKGGEARLVLSGTKGWIKNFYGHGESLQRLTVSSH